MSLSCLLSWPLDRCCATEQRMSLFVRSVLSKGSCIVVYFTVVAQKMVYVPQYNLTHMDISRRSCSSHWIWGRAFLEAVEVRKFLDPTGNWIHFPWLYNPYSSFTTPSEHAKLRKQWRTHYTQRNDSVWILWVVSYMSSNPMSRS
jgi:hypothetical protein